MKLVPLPSHQETICVIGIGKLAVETVNYLTKQHLSVEHDSFETVTLTFSSEKFKLCQADRNVLLEKGSINDINDFTDSLQDFEAVFIFCDTNDNDFAYLFLALNKALSATSLFRVNYIITTPASSHTTFAKLPDSIRIIDTYNCSSILLPYKDFVASEGKKEEIIPPCYRIASPILPLISQQFILQIDLGDMITLFKNNKVGFAYIPITSEKPDRGNGHMWYDSLIDRTQNDDIGCIIIGMCQDDEVKIQILSKSIEEVVNSLENKFSNMSSIIAMSCSSENHLVCCVYV